MNIFLRELKVHRFSLLFWSLGMVALIGSGMAKFAAYESAGQSLEKIMATLPRAVLVVFGISGFDLKTASGFFGVLFLYIAVMASVHAVLLGSTLISKEERDRTSEFLYAKPISRDRALTGKLLAGLVLVVILNLVTSVSSFVFVGNFAGDEPFQREVLLLMVGLLFLQLIFFAIGAVVAGVARRPKSAPSRATSVMFLTFLLYYLVNLNEGLGFLRYLSPFKYFDAGTLMTDGQLDPLFVVLSVVIIALAAFGTYHYFSERDLNV